MTFNFVKSLCHLVMGPGFYKKQFSNPEEISTFLLRSAVTKCTLSISKFSSYKSFINFERLLILSMIIEL